MWLRKVVQLLNNSQEPKRKKGRGFPSQHQVQPFKAKKLILPANSSFSKMKRRTSSTRFGQDDPLTGPLVGHHAGVAFPSYQNLNENNFRNCILTERARPNENEKLKTKHSGNI